MTEGAGSPAPSPPRTVLVHLLPSPTRLTSPAGSRHDGSSFPAPTHTRTLCSAGAGAVGAVWQALAETERPGSPPYDPPQHLPRSHLQTRPQAKTSPLATLPARQQPFSRSAQKLGAAHALGWCTQQDPAPGARGGSKRGAWLAPWAGRHSLPICWRLTCSSLCLLTQESPELVWGS